MWRTQTECPSYRWSLGIPLVSLASHDDPMAMPVAAGSIAGDGIAKESPGGRRPGSRHLERFHCRLDSRIIFDLGMAWKGL